MEPSTEKNWWGRNWKWVVPTGCLTGVVLAAGTVFLLVSLVFGIMKTSGAYKDGLARAQTDPAVVAALGTPVKARFFVSGNVNASGTSGTADLTIPISGPKGKGKIYLVAHKYAGEWQFSTLVVEIEESGERIDLLGQP